MEEVDGGRVTTAAGDDNLKDIFNRIRTSKSPSSIMALLGVVFAAKSSLPISNSARNSPNFLSSMQILMNVQKQHSIFDTPPPFISIEMVKGLMRCLVLEKSDCTIGCGCTHKVVYLLSQNLNCSLYKYVVLRSWQYHYCLVCCKPALRLQDFFTYASNCRRYQGVSSKCAYCLLFFFSS